MTSTSAWLTHSIIILKPKYVIWNNFLSHNLKLMKLVTFFGGINIVHETEGIPYDLELYKHTLSPDKLRFVSCILSWGSRQSQVVSRFRSKERLKTNTIPLGSIRYEYFKSLPDCDSHPDCSELKHVLWNTNFPCVSTYQSLNLNLMKVYLSIIFFFFLCPRVDIYYIVLSTYAFDCITNLTQISTSL